MISSLSGEMYSIQGGMAYFFHELASFGVLPWDFHIGNPRPVVNNVLILNFQSTQTP